MAGRDSLTTLCKWRLKVRKLITKSDSLISKDNEINKLDNPKETTEEELSRLIEEEKEKERLSNKKYKNKKLKLEKKLNKMMIINNEENSDLLENFDNENNDEYKSNNIKSNIINNIDYSSESDNDEFFKNSLFVETKSDLKKLKKD